MLHFTVNKEIKSCNPRKTIISMNMKAQFSELEKRKLQGELLQCLFL